MKKIVAVLVLPVLLLHSCSRLSEEEAFQKGKEALEQSQYDQAENFLNIVITEYPDGSKAPDAMLLLASMHQNEKGDLRKAVTMYLKLTDKYPESDAAPKALFTAAFIHANQLNEFEKARELYQRFIDRYPDHEMVGSARSEVENLGVDPNILLESLEKKKEVELRAAQ